MQRKLPDLSTTQMVASGVATLVAAIGASYLGVYGTILGAAFMSVVSTAGSTICKHLLDQGKEQIKELSYTAEETHQKQAARLAAAEAVRADPTRTVAWPGAALGGDPNATRVDSSAPWLGPNAARPDPNAARPNPNVAGLDPTATRADFPWSGDPNATRLDGPPAEAVADSLAEAAGERAVREAAWRAALKDTLEWSKQHWVKLVVSSAAVFAFVIAGISVYEATTGKPIGNTNDKGLTVTNVLGGGGGQTRQTPTQTPTTRETAPGGDTPSETPSTAVPSTGSSTAPPQEPTGQPTTSPTERPTTAPTASTPTAPSTPTPSNAPTGTGGGQNKTGSGSGAGDGSDSQP